MRIVLVVVLVLLLAAVVFGAKFVSIRNQLVTDREAISAAWAQVDVALKRRADLIPNLVETVKGFAAHEKGVDSKRWRMPGQRWCAGARHRR